MGAMTDLLFGVNIDKRSLSTLQDITSNGRFDSVKIMTVNLPVYVFSLSEFLSILGNKGGCHREIQLDWFNVNYAPLSSNIMLKK